MSDRRFICGLVLLTVVPLAAGCGGGRKATVEVVKVSGIVKLDGQPLADAEVNFLGQQYAGVAKTGPEGRYELEAAGGREHDLHPQNSKGSVRASMPP